MVNASSEESKSVTVFTLSNPLECSNGQRPLCRRLALWGLSIVIGIAISPLCLSQNVILPNTTVTSGSVSYKESNSITAANGYVINGSASVTFIAGGSVSLEPGFHATAGSAAITFDASIGQGTNLLVALSGQVTAGGAALPGVALAVAGTISAGNYDRC